MAWDWITALGRSSATGGPGPMPLGRSEWTGGPGPMPLGRSGALSPEAVVQGLVARGLPPHVAIGIAGNLAVESGFDPGINEIAPVVEGSRGGFGLAQWTGPRRRQLEAFAAEQGRDVSDPDLQLDFLMWEIGNSEAGNMADTLAASTPEEAAAEFMSDFLRPGIPHADRRLAETREIAGAFGSYGSTPTGTYAPDPAIAGAFGAQTAPSAPAPAPTAGNALLDMLTPFGASAPVSAPPMMEAPASGNALAALGDPMAGNAMGAAYGGGGMDEPAPQLPLTPMPALAPRKDAMIAQLLAAFGRAPATY